MNEIEKKEEKKNDVDDHSEEVFRWEEFLPKVTYTVLLVESDRATRRIITELLMKCKYKVIAVSDGVKAWKTLKMKTTEIDLILTEMELPTLSGLALLSLIMEHEICRNIPVIMMSSHDSRSMVMNCVRKGATDFLIKPVRRNELTNLWQHIWRKHVNNRPLQNTISVPTGQHESFQCAFSSLAYFTGNAQKKLKIATEDNFAGNQLTDSVSVAFSQKNNEWSEKLSGVQSTCAFPFSNAENACMDDMQNASLMKSSMKISNIDVLKHKEPNKFERGSTKHNDETGDSSVEQDYGTAEIEPKNEIFRADLSRENPDTDAEMHGCSDELIETSSRAIDLISTFGNLHKHTKEIHCISGDKETKLDFDKELKLSLGNDFSGSSCKQASEATEEWQILNNSDTSAFSWYDRSKMLLPLFPISDWNSDKSHELCVVTAQYGGSIKLENMTTAVMAQYVQHGQKLFNTGLLADNDFHHTSTPKSNCQKESSPFPSSCSSQSNSESNKSDHRHNCSYDLNQNVTVKTDMDHVVHDSPTADQGFGNDLCHASNHINRSCNDGRATSNVVTKNSESSSDGRHYNCDYDKYRMSESQCPSQRKEAIRKFLLKRSARSYGKKVRYPSRKTLAEKRHREKGQFVRKVHNDDHPNADANSGDQ